MEYKIEYGNAVVKTAMPKEKGRKLKIAVFGTVISITFISALLFPAELKKVLLPGNPEVTEKALFSLIENIKDGQPFNESVTAFCRVIIDNATPIS